MITDQAFWAKVDKSGECWLWTGAKNYGGYGVLRRWVDGQGKNYLAHRYSLMLVGRDPGRLKVDHKCYTPACVRPDHLQAVTNQHNIENRSGLNSNNKSGVRGVHWDSARQRWSAGAKSNGRWHYAGRFKDLADAEAAAVKLRNELMTNNLADRAS